MATQTGTDTVEQSSTVNSRWWYWIAAQPIMVVLVILSLGLQLGGMFLLLLFASAIVYFIGLFAYAADIKAIDNTPGINWNPSRLVYIGLAVFFGIFVALFYLYKRHKHVGTP